MIYATVFKLSRLKPEDIQTRMIHQINSALKMLIPVSLQFEIRQKKCLFIEFLKGLFFWKWQSFRFSLSETNATVIHYKGRLENKAVLMSILGIDPNVALHTNSSANEAFVTEYPMQDSLCMPCLLSTIVKLGRPIDEILATYSKSLRRSISEERSKYRYEPITDTAKVEAIEYDFLRPYAAARHDLGAWQLDSKEVKKLAQTDIGRLDLLYKDEEEVGCHLGNVYIRNGKRYWHVHRLGYSYAVFSDYKRWGEINSMNLHLALEAAIKNGYDYCDYGVSIARPGAGLIEWKRRRKGFLSTSENFKYFYMRLPKTGAAQFLWDSPAFAVERDKPTLHLGVPEGKTDEEIAARYREMGYGGLHKVYLNCTKSPSEQLIKAISSLYVDQESQPIVIIKIVK